jgi:uncharacterized short protein YbdD (DUF466 family)
MSTSERTSPAPSPVVGEGWPANVPNNAAISYIHVGQGEGVPSQNWLNSAWQTFRTLTGDDAYEKYCEHHQRHHADQPLLDRSAFYLKNQQKKWTGINRCC